MVVDAGHQVRCGVVFRRTTADNHVADEPLDALPVGQLVAGQFLRLDPVGKFDEALSTFLAQVSTDFGVPAGQYPVLGRRLGNWTDWFIIEIARTFSESHGRIFNSRSNWKVNIVSPGLDGSCKSGAR